MRRRALSYYVKPADQVGICRCLLSYFLITFLLPSSLPLPPAKRLPGRHLPLTNDNNGGKTLTFNLDRDLTGARSTVVTNLHLVSSCVVFVSICNIATASCYAVRVLIFFGCLKSLEN